MRDVPLTEGLDRCLPSKTIRENRRAIEEMQNAATSIATGFGRGVQQKRPHDQRGALACLADYLADSVAALEGIRLDLLRLHAGAGDLAPLTTLLDAARRIGEDLDRLAAAQDEVEDATSRRLGPRTPTPAQ